MGRLRSRQWGHNLLEMILAVVIFSTISVFLLGIWNMHYQAMSKSRAVLVATYLGEQVMEECIAARFDLVDTLYPPPPAVQELEVTSRTRAGEQTVIFEVMVSITPNGTSEKFVEVDVSWNGDTGRNTASFHTIIHQNG